MRFGRLPDRRLGVAAPERQRRRDELAFHGVELGHVEYERQFLILDLREPRGATRLFAGPCDDAVDRLAEELHNAVRQHRLVMTAGRRDIVLARNVLGGQHVDHAGRRSHRRQVHLPDPAMRDGRQAETAVQQAGRLGHVIDVDGRTGDVLVRRIVPLFGGDTALYAGSLDVRNGVLIHHAASCRVTVSGAFVSDVSTKKRLSRFLAASCRYSAVARMSVSGVKSRS